MSVIEREWVALEEATKMLGKSAKTVERLVACGELRSKLEARDGRKPQRLYHAGHLQRIKEQAIPAPAAEPKRALLPAKTTEIAIAPNFVTTLNDVMTKWLNRPESIGVREKLWLSLEEAQQYSGLSRNMLLDLCREGRVVACKSGGWRIRRASLEEFEG